MAIDISSLILDVQVSLSDLPEEFQSDEAVFKDLLSAQQYLDSIKSDDLDEDLEEESLKRLGAYFSYVNYTSLAERQLGTIPVTSTIKLETLRRLALAFVRQCTNLTIADDFSIDKTSEEKGRAIAATSTYSMFDDS